MWIKMYGSLKYRLEVSDAETNSMHQEDGTGGQNWGFLGDS